MSEENEEEPLTTGEMDKPFEEREEGPTSIDVTDKQISIGEVPTAVPQEEIVQEEKPKSLFPYSLELFSAHILPSCASIIPLHMYNPSPVPPLADLVTNFVNSLGNISGSIPSPVSFILTIT